MATVARALSVVGLALFLWACGPDDSGTTPSPPTTSTPAPGSAAQVRLRATLVQYRPDEGTRTVSAELTNAGARPVTVTSVALASAGIAPVRPTPKDTVFAPGQTIGLRTTYGEPACRSVRQGPARVVVGLRAGTRVVVRLDAPGRALLNRLYTRECDLARVRAVAGVSLAKTFSRVRVGGGFSLHGRLLVDRSHVPGTEDVPLTVESLAGSVLLSFEPQRGETALPRTLEAGTGSLRIPVLIGSSNRCDAHALGGSTQTFLLSAFVHIGDEPTRRVILIPDRVGRRQSLAVIQDACRSSGK